MAGAALHDAYMDTTPAIVGVNVTNQFVTFTCGDRAFGIDIMKVREIRSWSPITELPNQPHGAKGVLDIRGSIVQVFDLNAMIGGGGGFGSSESGRVVLVVSLKNQDVGLLVDAVSDIIFAHGDDLRPVPNNGSNRSGGTVSGLVKSDDRLIAILDLGELFPSEAGDGQGFF
ncbi:chemotaxis protein CheW [Devosia sp.]|uniref:chemotaxis protein CheW n=1 Tax=Devosia sp. TaxID=1871048 RepID=UPI00326604B8